MRSGSLVFTDDALEAAPQAYSRFARRAIYATLAPVMTSLERARYVREHLPAEGLFAEKAWRIPPRPFELSALHVELIEKLGLVLHRFNLACNHLYRQSAAGKAHPWVTPLLDAGKPADLIALGRHEKVKGQVSALIRPDLILTEDGFAMSELDSVPGGIGLTAWLQETYTAAGEAVLGGPDGMRRGFASVLNDGDVLISEESATYRPEMQWLVGAEHVKQVEDYSPSDKPAYRFFEAFDYPALTKFQEAWQPEARPLTPPLKPYLEEKLWLALFWSRPLQEFWRQEIGEKGQKLLQRIIPYSWVLDPTPLPVHAVIPELNIQSWSEMERFSQKQRDLVLKISGFSPLAWGSRGVHVGSDMSSEQWAEQVRLGLEEFSTHPRLLQRFAKGAISRQEYLNENEELSEMPGRARVCPYYFVANDRVSLGGVLVTLVPTDKKLIHGMSDAIISPGMAGASEVTESAPLASR